MVGTYVTTKYYLDLQEEDRIWCTADADAFGLSSDLIEEDRIWCTADPGWITGHSYRLGSADIESACVSHPAVAEAAAMGVPHQLKGNAINVFVILKSGQQPSPQLIEYLRAHIGHEVGPIAKPEKIEFVDKLPKPRSGKIMRRVLNAQVLGLDPGNISTLED